MTARLVFEATLIELSKLQAPSLKLYEFNYLFNKAINQYINKVYNVYDLNQQTTDDLRVLKATAYLTPSKWNQNNSATHLETRNASSYLSKAHKSIQSLHGATYEVAMPIDYLHLLNCVCIYYVAKQKDCWDAGSYIEIPATRLTADSWSQIITDIYNRPSPMKPYYYIHNQNNSVNNAALPTDPISGVSELGMPNGTDISGNYHVESNGIALCYTNNVTYDVAKINNKYYIIKDNNYYLFTPVFAEGTSVEAGKNYVGINTGIISQLSEEFDNDEFNDRIEFKFTIANNETNTSAIYAKVGEDWYTVSGLEIDKFGSVKTTGAVKFDKIELKSAFPNQEFLTDATMFYPDPAATIRVIENGQVRVQSGATFAGLGYSNFPRTFKVDTNADGKPDTNISLVEKPTALRAGNTSNVRMEIRYGNNGIFN